MYENVKLGKLEPKNDPRTLKIANYFTDDLPAPPKIADYVSEIPDWDMFANDRVGDCTFAAAGHMEHIWNRYGDQDGERVTEVQVLQGYADCTGYNPKDPSTDRGAVEHDVLQYWTKIGVGGHRIGAWGDIDPKNREHVMQSIYLFGGLYCGVALPKSAQNQEVWDVVSCFNRNGLKYSWGGHAVPAARYDDDFIWVVTWGGLKKMTWKFWFKYVDEAHAIISPEWFFVSSGKCPAGFDIEALTHDLLHVTA